MGNSRPKGVVLWVSPDRHPLAGATNTNEAALIRGFAGESMALDERRERRVVSAAGPAWHSPRGAGS